MVRRAPEVVKLTIWLPHANFAVCALVMETSSVQQCLDYAKMLDDPELETMWTGHRLALMLYGDCMVRELGRRGVETQWPVLLQSPVGPVVTTPGYRAPDPVGREEYHRDQRETMRALGILKEIEL